MSTRITKSLLLLAANFVLVFTVPAFAADPANDRVSAVPLAPGMTPSNDPLSITICGKPAQAKPILTHLRHEMT
jgi:hypothetical protein